ncbi:MAG: MarR family winged helix-turn-helix transcriptional regulator [Roseibium album]|uniref:Multiple antibiotic resistance protein MarR n=2 Tax=Roseibium album TaxID=311410 RepID=A0A0M7ASM6_9HYPH|nr:MarR family winged helix-turn-helix transcriptional regulator [Roseibium album]MBG6161235.1 DNA-binding MarR family transcriptional regulator [Labrenzia sp. EL_195]MBG6177235.1 DNA-binding MarR family transcriptional regulator [Labrenzia sp. EL_132]MBG6200752.1 DNA-binding MarR family transcriptional regulator [Labrenzia sp. EL_13]MBG6231856.1 DNA-binding MarR family transcriptional regulator [Labrenzia sp. EL_208]CTQ61601.1 Multiple antibiotic resistance protein MarR [Roseibium album]
MNKPSDTRSKPSKHLFGDPADLMTDRAERARRQWQKEVPEVAEQLLPMVLLGRLNEAAQLMNRDYLVPAYAKIGLKLGEFDVLATLVRSGPPYKLTPTELYRSTMMSSGGMTARVDKLEKAGLVERCPHPDDRRALTVCVTDKGLQLVKRMIPQYVDMQARAVEGLTANEQDQLSALLEKLIRTANDPITGK